MSDNDDKDAKDAKIQENREKIEKVAGKIFDNAKSAYKTVQPFVDQGVKSGISIFNMALGKLNDLKNSSTAKKPDAEKKDDTTKKP